MDTSHNIFVSEKQHSHDWYPSYALVQIRIQVIPRSKLTTESRYSDQHALAKVGSVLPSEAAVEALHVDLRHAATHTHG